MFKKAFIVLFLAIAQPAVNPQQDQTNIQKKIAKPSGQQTSHFALTCYAKENKWLPHPVWPPYDAKTEDPNRSKDTTA